MCCDRHQPVAVLVVQLCVVLENSVYIGIHTHTHSLSLRVTPTHTHIHSDTHTLKIYHTLRVTHTHIYLHAQHTHTHTVLSILNLLQQVTPLQHLSIAQRGEEEDSLEGADAENMLQTLVLQTDLQVDALPEVNGPAGSLLGDGGLARFVAFQGPVGPQDYVPLVPFLCGCGQFCYHIWAYNGLGGVSAVTIYGIQWCGCGQCCYSKWKYLTELAKKTFLSLAYRV